MNTIYKTLLVLLVTTVSSFATAVEETHGPVLSWEEVGQYLTQNEIDPLPLPQPDLSPLPSGSESSQYADSIAPTPTEVATKAFITLFLALTAVGLAYLTFVSVRDWNHARNFHHDRFMRH
ncbi:MAG: hypothetical protein SGI71_06395 [Verrucomicrobiota bacterium]|nr:hypothetical protein [Verrucomicrobiota bacterium]